MALVSVRLMVSLSSCDWLALREDDSKAFLHSAREAGDILSVNFNPEDTGDLF